MVRKVLPTVSALILTLFLAVPVLARGEGNPHGQPVVYVTGQGLAYDSVVTADPLPFEGPFQKLEPGGPTGLQTDVGPGDPDYVGGRWWMDTNGNDEMDPDDHYFECPLLGPGFEVD